MIKSFVAAAAAVMLGTAACSQQSAVEISPELKSAARNWTARLASPSELEGAIQAQGTAILTPGSSESETRVEVRLSNVAPGGVHPWKLQTGRCGASGQELLRMTSNEDMLKVNSSGEAEAAAVVQGMALPTSGTYSVVVMASPDNQNLMIACGNFAPPPGGSTPQP